MGKKFGERGKRNGNVTDEDIRIRLIFSPRTPPVYAQRAQVRNLHNDARMCVREERGCARVRIQQGQLETPPTGGSVIIAAPERHLV